MGLTLTVTPATSDQEWSEKLRYAYEQSKMFEDLYLKYEALYHQEVAKNKA